MFNDYDYINKDLKMSFQALSLLAIAVLIAIAPQFMDDYAC